MSVNIVLPSLSAWAAARLTGLLQSKTQSDFDAAFDATFAAQCQVTVNGQSIARDAYKTRLLSQSAAAFGEANTTVTIDGQTQVETGNQGQLSGLVGLFYTALSDSTFRVLGAPSEKRETSSLNLVIEPTAKQPPSPPVPVRGYVDRRRVVAVNQVVAESTHHVTIPTSSVPKPTEPLTCPAIVRLPAGETGAKPETLPGDGAFGVAPVVIPGETIGDSASQID